MKHLPCKKEMILALTGAGFGLFGFLWFRLSEHLGESALFMRKAGLALSNFLCRLWSHIPIPVSELVWIFGIICGISLLIYKTARGGFSGFLGGLCHIILAGGIMYALFSFVYLVQYSAPPIASQLNMKVEKYDTETLYDTACIVAEELNKYAPLVDRDEEGLFSPPPYDEIAARVLESYKSGSASALFAKSAGIAPKEGFLLSKVMSHLNLSGYYFPLTGESIVSTDLIETSIPFTLAHEVSHSFGTGPEKEANFLAFLCCIESGDPYLTYSGLFNGYIYLNNALIREDEDLWRKVRSSLSEDVDRDLKAKTAHLKKYEGPVNDLGSSVNDAFIKSTGQEAGLKSYGLVTDMIIAYYQAQ